MRGTQGTTGNAVGFKRNAQGFDIRNFTGDHAGHRRIHCGKIE
jgi:hypothetical protein